MDEREFNSMLAEWARRCSSAPLLESLTPECLPMPVLIAMARDSEAGTPEERAHMEACGFCSRMVALLPKYLDELSREEDVEPLLVAAPPGKRRARKVMFARFVVPGTVAACLVLGFTAGLATPYHRYDPEAMEQVFEHAGVLTELLRGVKDADDPHSAATDESEQKAALREQRVRERCRQLLEAIEQLDD